MTGVQTCALPILLAIERERTQSLDTDKIVDAFAAAHNNRRIALKYSSIVTYYFILRLDQIIFPFGSLCKVIKFNCSLCTLLRVAFGCLVWPIALILYELTQHKMEHFVKNY